MEYELGQLLQKGWTIGAFQCDRHPKEGILYILVEKEQMVTFAQDMAGKDDYQSWLFALNHPADYAKLIINHARISPGRDGVLDCARHDIMHFEDIKNHHEIPLQTQEVFEWYGAVMGFDIRSIVSWAVGFHNKGREQVK